MHDPTLKVLEGVARCSRYAYGPNKLRMCGPDQQAELSAYIQTHERDQGLNKILSQFKTLYPYLESIAQANHIRDPFDDRVVKAYWIGNELLEAISPKQFYAHLTDSLTLKRKMNQKNFAELAEKLPVGARMHHSFHVLNVYKRTGQLEILHTLESMDACRVSWGKVTTIDGGKITLHRKPLLLHNNKLLLGDPIVYTLTRKLDDNDVFDEAGVGDWVTIHWHKPCEIVNDRDVRFLEFYTNKHIQLSNMTL